MRYSVYRISAYHCSVYSLLAGLLSSSCLAATPNDPNIEPVKQQFPRTFFASDKPFTKNEPVMLSASQMDYDQNSGVVTATGDVEVTQGATVILADELIYDQTNNKVKVRGNVSMMETSGNVIFADEAELKDDLRKGVIKEFKARLLDDSLLVADSANKVDEYITKLSNAVYSPCKVRCDTDGKGRAPMWQLRADEVTIDQEKQTIVYDDASFEVFGFPVLYTPYLTHATPGADNKSGILPPEFSQNTNLGAVFKMPVYYTLSPDKDFTITPIYTTGEGLVIAGEYRQRLDEGGLSLEGSITRPRDRDSQGFLQDGREIRGHANAEGKFNIDEQTSWGFDVEGTTDDTYLRRYDFGGETLLTSRIYAERFGFTGDDERSYGSVQALAFQGLRANDDTDLIPIIAPLADFNYESQPGLYNSRILLNANTVVVSRSTGSKSRRLSLSGGWKLPFITQDGQIIEFKTQLRGDIYSVENVPQSGGKDFDGTTGRIIPEISANWRYPFLKQWDGENSLMIEPVVAFAISPKGGNPEDIPNEDSLVPEFTDTNLFAGNRFAGYDRVETGPRVSYGVRGQAQLFSDKYIDWLFGQHYRTETDQNFPFSNDINDNLSDYVGKVGVYYLPFDIAYRFRLDKKTFSAKRNEVDATFNYDPLSVSTSYLELRNDPVLASRKEVSGTATISLTDEWSWRMLGRKDLLLGQITSVGTGLIFKNECTYLMAVVGKEFTRDRDVKPATTFLFRIALKNLE